MKLLAPLLSLILTASSVASFNNMSLHVRHEHRRNVPDGWNVVRRAPPTVVLPLKIGLLQPNIDELEDHLHDVSHPDSPHYGQHWSPAKIAHFFRPSQESINIVWHWLESEGIDAARIKLSKSRGWIDVQLSVEEAELLLSIRKNVRWL